MISYPLLINGNFVDTGKYRYVSHADKAISNPIKAIKLQRDAQKGILNSEIKDFIYARYSIADEVCVEKASKAAYVASQKFRDFSFSRRARILNDIHDLLIKNKNNIIELMKIEGHPERLAEWEFSGMEIAYRPECIEYFKTQLRGSYGKWNGENLGWIRKPDGVVCVSPPGNASCSNSLTAGFALLGGNSLIVKPPLRAPIATLFLWHDIVWEALRRNNAPPGTVNTIVGNSKIIMDHWLDSQFTNDIYFFGDSSMGLEIGRRAFEKGKKPILELSGNDMMLVWKDGDIDAAADSLSDAYLGSTQICMVPKKAMVHEDVYDEFLNKFIERTKAIQVGLPTNNKVHLTPVTRKSDFRDFLEDALNHGAKLVYGGMFTNHLGEILDNGDFIIPAVLRIDDVMSCRKLKCVEEENFFPLIPVIKVASASKNKDSDIFNKMILVANQNRYGLRTSVWVTSNFYLAKFIKLIDRCGMLRINSRHTGFSSFLSTHGGPGLSGGPYGELNYIWQKTTHLQGVSVSRNTYTSIND